MLKLLLAVLSSNSTKVVGGVGLSGGVLLGVMVTMIKDTQIETKEYVDLKHQIVKEDIQEIKELLYRIDNRLYYIHKKQSLEE